MNLTEITKWRNFIGKAGALFSVLIFLILLDGLIARFREPANVFKVLPGTTVEINGPLAGEIKDLRDLTYRSDSPHLELTFFTLHQGYFLGGDMWRGELKVSPRISPGEYHLTIMPKGQAWAKPLPPFSILAYADPRSRQEAAKSLVLRHTGFSPWLAGAFSVPLILLAFGAVFYHSQRRDALLALEGKAEIYRLARGEGGFAVRFGLGAVQGVAVGDRLTIIDAWGRIVATCEVQEVNATDSLAQVPGDQEVKVGYIVSLGQR